MSMITQTAQAAALAALSNLLAQGLNAYQSNKPFHLNTQPLFQFIIFAILNTPPNVLWQQQLEDWFPGYVQAPTPTDAKDEKRVPKTQRKLSIRNTLAKFFIDQTIGAFVNTLIFFVLMGTIQGASTNAIIERCKQKTIPMIMDGYKFWPIISLLNFSVVPVDKRIVVGSTAGVLWGIYLSMTL